jgi:hypothetical protein
MIARIAPNVVQNALTLTNGTGADAGNAQGSEMSSMIGMVANAASVPKS